MNACIKSKRCFNVKSSAYHFYMKTKILADLQICISVPLSKIKELFVTEIERINAFILFLKTSSECSKL